MLDSHSQSDGCYPYFASMPHRRKMKNSKKSWKKKNMNYSVDLSILILFTALAYNGMLLQVVYHIGERGPNFTVMGLDRNGWLVIHKILSVLSAVGIGVHIKLHWSRIRAETRKGLFIRRSLSKNSSYYFFIAYGISGILGFISWAFNNNIVGNHPFLQHALVEIHDKVAFVLIFLFAFHLKNGFRWMLNRTKDVVALFPRA